MSILLFLPLSLIEKCHICFCMISSAIKVCYNGSKIGFYEINDTNDKSFIERRYRPYSENQCSQLLVYICLLSNE